MEDYYWSTTEYHPDNNFTMDDYLNNHLPEKAKILMQDGTYAEIEYHGEKFALHASGDGDSYNHKIEVELIDKTPKDMSDNAEKYLNRFDIWDHPRITNRNETESYDVTELMQSYTEQHLEDVLRKAENDFNQEQAVDLANKYANVCSFKSDFPHDYQSVVDGYSEGFKVGYQFALNLLKQRKG